MRFLIYGESWRGSMPYSAARALKALGHEVEIFDYTRHLFSRRFSGKIGIALNILLFRNVATSVNNALRKVTLQGEYDALLVYKGLHLWAEIVDLAHKKALRTININNDEFFNPIHQSRYLMDAFRLYDLIVTPRRHLIEEYLSRGARSVKHLPFCFDPSTHYPVLVREVERGFWGGQVAFIGSWSDRREKILSALTEFDLRIWGSSWKHAGRRFRCSSGVRIGPGRADCEDMSRVINASLINLNILTVENRDLHNPRNFEILACGGFQLAERSEDVLQMFEEDRDIVCYGSGEELRDKCKHYLKHDGQRVAIAKAGHAQVMKGGHTYLDRMRELESFLGAL